MATSATAMEYANRLIENDYVQDKLREAGAKLGDAKKRASKRRIDAATDTKVQAQVGEAVAALNEAVLALRADRKSPKPSWGKRLAVVAGLGVVSAGVALAASDELRAKLFGEDSPESASVPASQPSETATVAA
jgi:hypothetical protein